MNDQPAISTDGSVPAAIPANDAARLAELHNFCILDTEKDPRFDRITRLTADLLHMPVVLVSLVDEAREWFKSAVGTEVAEITRGHGFCAHAILSDSDVPFTIADTLEDPRFATHPFVVTGPKLRFYSGAPLLTTSGHKIGMLCVHDVKPRHDFGADEEKILRQLAAITMDEIDYHRIETERGLLIGELSHRVKNVFATIQSVASVSGRGDAAAKNYIESFNQRLGAMAAAHDQLVANSWKGARLDGLVGSIVSAFQNVDRNRFSLDVAPVTLEPLSAQTLALLLHELLTNAIKHGSLSGLDGRVSISAREGNFARGNGLSFIWHETNGPAITPPIRQGFGHRMLLAAIKHKGGTVDFDWQTTGLVCRFDFFYAK